LFLVTVVRLLGKSRYYHLFEGHRLSISNLVKLIFHLVYEYLDILYWNIRVTFLFTNKFKMSIFYNEMSNPSHNIYTRYNTTKTFPVNIQFLTCYLTIRPNLSLSKNLFLTLWIMDEDLLFLQGKYCYICILGLPQNVKKKKKIKIIEGLLLYDE